MSLVFSMFTVANNGRHSESGFVISMAAMIFSTSIGKHVLCQRLVIVSQVRICAGRFFAKVGHCFPGSVSCLFFFFPKAGQCLPGWNLYRSFFRLGSYLFPAWKWCHPPAPYKSSHCFPAWNSVPVVFPKRPVVASREGRVVPVPFSQKSVIVFRG